MVLKACKVLLEPFRVTAEHRSCWTFSISWASSPAAALWLSVQSRTAVFKLLLTVWTLRLIWRVELAATGQFSRCVRACACTVCRELREEPPPWPLLNRLHFGRGLARDLENLKRLATRPRWPHDEARCRVWRCERQYFCHLTGTTGRKWGVEFSITSTFIGASSSWHARFDSLILAYCLNS